MQITDAALPVAAPHQPGKAGVADGRPMPFVKVEIERGRTGVYYEAHFAQLTGGLVAGERHLSVDLMASQPWGIQDALQRPFGCGPLRERKRSTILRIRLGYYLEHLQQIGGVARDRTDHLAI